MQKTDVPELSQLFKLLEEGQMPNCIQLIAAISDISSSYPEYDSAQQGVRTGESRYCRAPLGPDSESRCQNC